MDENDLLDEVDVALLAELAEVYGRLDPIPSGRVEKAQFAINVAHLESELAEITRDAAVGVRADEDATDSITFTHPSVSLMVSSAVTGRVTRLDGWVTYGGAEVEVISGSWSRTVTADASGRFSLEDVPRGSVHFVIRRGPGQRRVVTPTVEL